MITINRTGLSCPFANSQSKKILRNLSSFPELSCGSGYYALTVEGARGTLQKDKGRLLVLACWVRLLFRCSGRACGACWVDHDGSGGVRVTILSLGLGASQWATLCSRSNCDDFCGLGARKVFPASSLRGRPIKFLIHPLVYSHMFPNDFQPDRQWKFPWYPPPTLGHSLQRVWRNTVSYLSLIHHLFWK